MSHPINGSNNHKPRRPRPVTFTKNSTVRKNNQLKCSRLLISVNIPGSAGPLRFLVNEEELVANVISTALRSYAREGRLPVLGSDLNNFLLYCANAGSDALTPWEPIGSHGGRNFILCKKQQIGVGDERATGRVVSKGSGSWKSWLNRCLSFIISSH